MSIGGALAFCEFFSLTERNTLYLYNRTYVWYTIAHEYRLKGGGDRYGKGGTTMDRQTELTKEQQYTAHVQQLLLAVVERSRDYSQGHLGSIRALLADAWEELRLKPTALSVQDMEQLSAEVDRFLARKTLTDNLAKRYEAMLMNPFFARVDFQEDGAKEKEKIVIGLYSLKDTDGEILVHDWRAPVSNSSSSTTSRFIEMQNSSMCSSCSRGGVFCRSSKKAWLLSIAALITSAQPS